MAASKRRKTLWIIWGLLTAGLVAYMSYGLFSQASAKHPLLSPGRALMLPGQTTHGHHQIEMACETCHTQAFGGGELIQEACVSCHGDALKEARDSHPASKFDDPRNAERLDKLDAQLCITCHVEHRKPMTHTLGVSLPKDFCFHCHSGEEEMPPSHKDFAFDGCTAAGCHNFHDNRALYEDFLLKHLNEPKLLAKMQVPAKELSTAVHEMSSYPREKYPLQPLTLAPLDAPTTHQGNGKLQADWLSTAHAKAGVNCSGCHLASTGAKAGQWNERPDHTACASCHAAETKGFLGGLHGMRLAQDLPAMTPAQAQLPMHKDAAHKQLGCTSCHSAHRFDVASAAVDACLTCHNDQHTQAYKQSPHFRLWQDELAGKLPPGSGVTCATCHLPRQRMSTADGSRMVVQHDQNETLRPNSKMLRPVCQHCHGYEFAIDALADPALIAKNFKGSPKRHVDSAAMAAKKDEEIRRKRAQGTQ